VHAVTKLTIKMMGEPLFLARFNMLIANHLSNLEQLQPMGCDNFITIETTT